MDNETRKERAREALYHLEYIYGNGERQTNIIDFLTDLIHLTSDLDVPRGLSAVAEQHYEEENPGT